MTGRTTVRIEIGRTNVKIETHGHDRKKNCENRNISTWIINLHHLCFIKLILEAAGDLK